MDEHSRQRRGVRLLTGLVLVAGVSGLGALATPVHATGAPSYTFNVNSTADDANSHDTTPGDGRCDDALGRCTVRAATEEASNASYPTGTSFTINVPAGTYRLTQGELTLGNNTIYLMGAGPGNTVFDGNAGNTQGRPPATPAAQGSRIFYTGTNATPTIQSVTVQDGNGTAGASGGGGTDGQGGGIFSDGGLTMINDIVTNNVASVTATTTVSIDRYQACPGPGNNSNQSGIAAGGGLMMHGNASLAIQSATFTYNSAIALPSAANNGQPYGLACGGAISDAVTGQNQRDDSPTISTSGFFNNLAQGGQAAGGGALYFDSGNVGTFYSVQIKFNVARQTATLAPSSGCNSNSFSNPCVIARGGGLFNDLEPLHLAGVWVAYNRATASGPNTRAMGGGIDNEDVMSIDTGSTIANNTASAAQFAGGGGIANNYALSLGSTTGAPVSIYNNVASTTFSTTSTGTIRCNQAGMGVPPSTTPTLLTVNACTEGGGVLSDDDFLALYNVSILSNRATASVCPTGTCAAGNTNTAAAEGGGVFNTYTYTGQRVRLSSNSVATTTRVASGGTTYGYALGGGAYNGPCMNSPLYGTCGGNSNTSSQFNMQTSQLRENTSSGDGGGIYDVSVAAGQLSLTSTTVAQNHAAGTGGGVYNIVPFSRTSSPIVANTAKTCANVVVPCSNS